ncbi:Succinyl-CoA ligase subunit beta [Sarcoptes scabiei]|nr:Succinyl-CoA ligase subunit beta [Sarcoptes scabiei]
MKEYLLIIWINLMLLKNDSELPFLETEWFQTYWIISFPIVSFYLGLILFWNKFIAKNYTKLQNEAMKILINDCLKLWNFSLFIFSLAGTFRVGKEFTTKLSIPNGFILSFCDADYFLDRKVYFWYFLFVISKLFEMGDTAFLLIRSKPIRFIHWFHHSITMIYSFYIAAFLPAIGRWMSSMNFFVHTLMYGYYFSHSIKLYPPKFVSIFITMLQTSQMFIGLLINLAAFYVSRIAQQSFADQQKSTKCQNDGWTVEFGVLMYLAYVWLFFNLSRDSFRKMKCKEIFDKRISEKKK